MENHAYHEKGFVSDVTELRANSLVLWRVSQSRSYKEIKGDMESYEMFISYHRLFADGIEAVDVDSKPNFRRSFCNTGNASN